MKQIISTLVLSVMFIALFAQYPHRPNYTSTTSQQQVDHAEEEAKAVVKNKLSRIDLLGYQFEKSFSNQNTVAIASYLDFFYTFSGEGSTRIGIGVLPKAEISFRHYYNLEKRKRLNKPYQKNSGSYFAGKFEMRYLFLPLEPKDIYKFTTAVTGVVWGFQNNEGPLTLNFEIGAGFGGILQQRHIPDKFGPTLLGKLKLGFLLGK